MGSLIDLGVKFSGLGWIWDKVDGYKTYISAIAGMLTGLLGLITEIVPIINQHKAGPLIEFVKGLPDDQSWLMILGGLAVLGLGHKISKASETADINAEIAQNKP